MGVKCLLALRLNRPDVWILKGAEVCAIRNYKHKQEGEFCGICKVIL